MNFGVNHKMLYLQCRSMTESTAKSNSNLIWWLTQFATILSAKFGVTKFVVCGKNLNRPRVSELSHVNMMCSLTREWLAPSANNQASETL